MSNFMIRPPQLDDRKQWEILWRDYLEFYNSSVPKTHTDILWERIQNEGHPIRCFVAERTSDSDLIGLVHFFAHADTWEIEKVCYLQDLYVAQSARLEGVGTALVKHVKEFADKQDWVFVYWQTKQDNFTARRLYDKLTGGTNGFITYRLGQRSS